jgi:hypothetical protein
VQQVIGSISCILKVPEPTAEEILCLGLRILFKKLTKTDAVLPRADLYGTDRVGGKTWRLLLPYGTKEWEETRPPWRREGRQPWSIQLIAELANPRILYICHQSQARLHNLEKSVLRKGMGFTNIARAIQVAKSGKYLLIGLPGIRGLVDSGRSADLGYLWSTTTLPELAAMTRASTVGLFWGPLSTAARRVTSQQLWASHMFLESSTPQVRACSTVERMLLGYY